MTSVRVVAAAAVVVGMYALSEPLMKLFRKKTAKVKLMYFNIAGKGEPVR